MGTIIPHRGLVVSCQASEDEPLHGSHHMAAMARAAKMGGAVAIRANGADDISAIREAVNLPIIGIKKKYYANYDIYITPTVADAVTVHEAGADIVAIDGTKRARPDKQTLAETIAELHRHEVTVMTDVSTFEEGVHAATCGADYVATTLSGYTPYSPQQQEPDLALVSKLAEELAVPVVAEGRIRSPQQAVAALDAGAHFVVVGGAITRPQEITARYADAIRGINVPG